MPLVIPIFISHRGCPHQCLFCNQHAIVGDVPHAPAPDVAATIETWLARSANRPAQLAFYGGSFSCLPQQEQRDLLAPAQKYLHMGRLQSIRISTRPDCLDSTEIDFLHGHGVRLVELGIQSFAEDVLRQAQRGHTAEQSRQAIRLLQQHGMAVGVQLLPGLPGDSWPLFLSTLRETISCRPALVRLYPALVLAGAELADMYRHGLYRPLSLPRAVAWLSRARELLDAAGIPVARIGLQASAALKRQLLAGPYHPALGELAASRRWFKEVRRRLAALPAGQKLIMQLSARDLSAVLGEKRKNMRRLDALGYGGRLQICIDSQRERGTVVYAVG